VAAESELSYRAAGVDRDAANRAKDRILELVAGTVTPDVVPNPGGFGGLFRMPGGYRRPLMVSSADGVGTKLKVATRADRHEGVGHDIVNHCANDILVEGARPLFFLDYIGMGRLEPGTVEQIVGGIATACRTNGCALLGGETAEMPDVYAPGEYDLAGFIVGVVDEENRPGAHRVKAGDALIGLAGDGFHTNGYSLLRRLLFDRLALGPDDPFPDMDASVADVLLRPHRPYGPALLPLLDRGAIRALAHITGGGILENLDRVIPEGLSARVDLASWQIPQEFRSVAERGGITTREMFRTFNMGVGMVAIVERSSARSVVSALEAAGETAWHLGEVTSGIEKVVLTRDGTDV
jgi:phosphoribosylformylglycinamidine cyclo-ligase